MKGDLCTLSSNRIDHFVLNAHLRQRYLQSHMKRSRLVHTGLGFVVKGVDVSGEGELELEKVKYLYCFNVKNRATSYCIIAYILERKVDAKVSG